MRLLGLPASFYRAALNPALEASPVACGRAELLALIERAVAAGLSVRAACELARVPKATYYRWRERVKLRGLLGLNDGRAGNRRQRLAPARSALRPLIEELRQRHAYGKHKLRVLLARVGVKASASSIGRVIRELVGRGVILNRTGFRRDFQLTQPASASLGSESTPSRSRWVAGSRARRASARG